MNKQDIQLLYKYNHWANTRILNAASNLTPEQFLTPASFPHRELRGTLTHALFAEWIWRSRLQGESPTHHFKPEDFPTFNSLRARWREEEKAMNSFIEGLTDEKLSGIIQYKTTKGVVMENIFWQVMAHLFYHGTQHRSEAVAILTELGQSPGDIDLIVFLREQT